MLINLTTVDKIEIHPYPFFIKILPRELFDIFAILADEKTYGQTWLIFLIIGLIWILSFALQKNVIDKKVLFYYILEKTILALLLVIGYAVSVSLYCFLFDWEAITSMNIFHDMSYLFNYHTEPTQLGLYFQILVMTAVMLILSSSYLFFTQHNKTIFEFPIIAALMTFFLCCLIDSTDFFVSFVCVIGFSLNIYVLILANAQNKACCEAAIKYFYLSSIASAFLAFSLWLNYLIFFSLNFITIEDTLKEWDFINDNAESILFLSTHFLCYGLFFKLAAFPCHLWAASVYDGSPFPVMAFFVLPIKAAVLAFVFKIFYTVLKDIYAIYVYIFWFSAFFSLLFGALSALVEKKIKKFFAYSSINQMGFLLMGIIGGNSISLQASILYLLVYVITNLGLFIILLNTFEVTTKRTLLYLTDFTSFATNNFKTAVLLTIILFSMAGIPPLVGFFGKYYLFLALYTGKFYSLILIGMFTSLLSAYYYLRIIKQMLFDVKLENNTIFYVQVSDNLQIVVYFVIGFLLISTLFFDGIIGVIVNNLF